MSWAEDAELPDLPAIFQVMAPNLEALEAVKQLNETLSFGNSSLSRAQEEAIATVVAVVNRSRYGAMIHAGFLHRYTQDPDFVSHLLSDYTQADLKPADRRMLDFAVRATFDAASLTKADTHQLLEAGFHEQEVLSIVLTTCLFNFMNRLANSFGLDVPPHYRKAVESWITGPATQRGWLMDQPAAPEPQTPAEDLHQGSGFVEVSDRADPSPHLASEAAGTSSVPDAASDARAPAPPTDMRSVTRFIAEYCVISPEAATSARDLYIAYLRWCDDNHEPPLLQRNFGVNLTQRGFRRRRRGQGRHWWLGIGLPDAEN